MIPNQAVRDVSFPFNSQLLHDVRSSRRTDLVTGCLHRPEAAPSQTGDDEGLEFDKVFERIRSRALRDVAPLDGARSERKIYYVKLTRTIRQLGT